MSLNIDSRTTGKLNKHFEPKIHGNTHCQTPEECRKSQRSKYCNNICFNFWDE